MLANLILRRETALKQASSGDSSYSKVESDHSLIVSGTGTCLCIQLAIFA